MTTNHPGYLIPDNPQPDGLYCLKVFIPRDETYLYAFSGAFQFFGKWLAWQRDAGHNATLAAAAWRDAIQYTFDNGWLDSCDDCPPPAECPDPPGGTIECNNCGNRICIILEIDPCVLATNRP